MIGEQTVQKEAVGNIAVMIVGITLGIGIALAMLALLLVVRQPGFGPGLYALGATVRGASPPLPGALAREARTWGLIGREGEGVAAFWYMSRSAGIISYVLLWGSVAWGLVVSTKILDGAVRRPSAFAWHEQLSLAALAVGAFHAVVLMGDRFISFSWKDILIPFAASYEPVAVGLGIVGFYVAALVTGSFYVRNRIGARTWRKLHYMTFVVYILVTLHGFAIGSDTQSLLMKLVYLGSMSVILFLVYYRLLTAGADPVRRPRSRGAESRTLAPQPHTVPAYVPSQHQRPPSSSR